MYEGEVREAEKTDTVEELIRTGYLIEQQAENVAEKQEVRNEAKRGKSKRN